MVSLHISAYTLGYSLRNIWKAIEICAVGFEQNTVWSHRFLLKNFFSSTGLPKDLFAL